MDRKDLYQREADELADQRYGKDFYDLSSDIQYQVYAEAMVEVNDRLVMQAESRI